MPTEIYLVKAGMTMTEGIVAEWYVSDGDEVKEGELLYRLETEKVELEVDASSTGTVRHLVSVGTTLEPGDVVGYVFAPGEEIPDPLPVPRKISPDAVAVVATDGSTPPDAAAAASGAAQGEGGRVPASPAARRLARELGIDIGAVAGTGPGGRVLESDVQGAAASAASKPAPAAPVAASPLAKRRAKELGVELANVQGTGPGGRITKDDVEAAAQAPAPASAAAVAKGPAAGETIAVRGMRRTIAQRMYESLQSTAQLTMDMEVGMDDAVRLREQLIAEWESEGVRPTYTDLVIRATSKALRLHPRMNSEFRETEIALLEQVNVGMAVALEEGLVVPVIRDSDQLGIKELAIESARLARAAREGKLGMDDFHGGTFTVTALGMFGVESFTPILNPPQAGILGVNRVYEGLAWEGERPVKQRRMRLSLTWDHRVLDGAPAAEFLATVRDLLEAPYRLMI